MNFDEAYSLIGISVHLVEGICTDLKSNFYRGVRHFCSYLYL